MRVLACGDTHGRSLVLKEALAEAQKDSAEWVFQLGDFGYWEHTREGVAFLDACDEYAKRAGIPIVFLDGNHDNHVLLWDRYADADRSPEGFWQIRPNIFYAPRGHRWTWAGRSFLALGGAYSIDRQVRTLGESYWLTEEITPEEADRACEGGLVDVMFSHDAPMSIDVLGGGALIIPETEFTRRRLERVVETVRPGLLVHGHWHWSYSDWFTHRDGAVTKVHGLAADGRPGTFLTLDIQENR